MIIRKSAIKSVQCHGLLGGVDPALCACVAKVVANTVTYPIDTIKLLKQTQTQPVSWSKVANIPTLYKGYNVFLPYNISNNVISHYLYFNTCKVAQNIFHDATHVIIAASFVSSVVTCVYKVPMLFLVRNSNIGRTVTLDDFFKNKDTCIKSFLVQAAEDFPETVVKFYLNHFLQKTFIDITNFQRALVIGVIMAILLAPFDTLKTNLLCRAKTLTSNFVVFMRILSTVTNNFVFFLIFTATSS